MTKTRTKFAWYKHKHLALFYVLSIMSAFTTMQSQDALVTAGGQASGSMGKASYSVGQIIQNNIIDTNGSVIQGIQFAFDDATLDIVDMETNFNISTYPNPTSTILNLKIDNLNLNDLSYQLFSMDGKLLRSEKLTKNTTQIAVADLPNAFYLLKLTDKQSKLIKTFKIIKK